LRAADIAELLPFISPEKRARVGELLQATRAVWRPQPGPQSDAYASTADVIGYGGAAGGGKSDLMIGAMLTQHRKGIIFRREATQLTGLVDRLTDLLGSRDGYNGQEKIWRLAGGKQIEFGSVPNLGDETKYQGRPHDFIGFDEAANFLESQVRFLLGWLRTTVKEQHCKALLTFNPPTTAEGRWVISFFAPWLDDKHPNPAAPGELRWFATVDGKEVEVGSEPFKHEGELITPRSRTFIASHVADNPFLMNTGYMATLQSLPEPLRSQMLKGDFNAGMEDDPWQVIPTAWIDAAMARWKPRDAKGVMDSMGVDVARGGRDETIISRRHGVWFDELIAQPGRDTPDGPTVATQVIAARRDLAPVHIDVVGWGSSPYDFLISNRIQAEPINGAETAHGRTEDDTLDFYNRRAELWWRMREALDPLNADPIALPPDNALRADLAAPKWTLKPKGILVEAKADMIKRLGRSPDRGDAVGMALIATMKVGASQPRRARSAGYVV
jgi:hypothetical protein